MATAESLSFQKDITDLIDELGEPFTFSRDGVKMASVNGVYGLIKGTNVQPTDASVIQSTSKVISIKYTKKYLPELSDIVQDSDRNLYQVLDVQTARLNATTICYILTVA